MPLEYRLDFDLRLVTVAASGETSEKEWMDLFLNIKNDARRVQDMDYLFDLREHRSTVSEDYLSAVSRRIAPLVPAEVKVKWAFVTLREVSRSKVETFARHLALVNNIEIRSFSAPDDALAWIEEDRESRQGVG